MRQSAPAILNQDNRATDEAVWLERTIGRKTLFEITGLVAHPMYPVAKFLWLRKPTGRMCLLPRSFPLVVIGYILSRLGLPPYIDYSLASRYLAFDIRQQGWSQEILAATEINVECLPIPVPAGTIVGKTRWIRCQSNSGLMKGTMVAMGGHDQPCGALGSWRHRFGPRG